MNVHAFKANQLFLITYKTEICMIIPYQNISKGLLKRGDKNRMNRILQDTLINVEVLEPYGDANI